MNSAKHNTFLVIAALVASVVCPTPAGSQVPVAPDIPDNFTADLQFADRLRSSLWAQSEPPGRQHETGQRVFAHLVAQLQPPARSAHLWTLRIANLDDLNAFPSPDGTVYIARGLAKLAGSNAGLWAAMLAHEVAHISHRDWARRYVIEKQITKPGAALELGSGGVSGAWMDHNSASDLLARFCRQMEVEADAQGLLLMVRGGYHPDFAPALYHLLRAHQVGHAALTEHAMHPAWQARDQEWNRASQAAGIEFDGLWPDRTTSPGGNPPVLVFIGEVKSASDHRELRVPLHCENLSGSIQVVLRTRFRESQAESTQVTGCTSVKTLITFVALSPPSKTSSGASLYVLDDNGAVLSYSEIRR